MDAATPVQYQRLPGGGMARKGSSFIAATRTTCRLWLGDDHLLQVESMGGYSETYKRFYFRDIQAIIVQRTRTWVVWNIVLGFFAGGLLILLLATIPKTLPSRWTSGAIGGKFSWAFLF